MGNGEAYRIHYEDLDGRNVSAHVNVPDGWVFQDPYPLGESQELVVDPLLPVGSDELPPPMIAVQLGPGMTVGNFTPQGWGTVSENNLGVWINYDGAQRLYSRGDEIGRFEYTVRVRTPSESRAPSNRRQDQQSGVRRLLPVSWLRRVVTVAALILMLPSIGLAQETAQSLAVSMVSQG